MKKRGSFFTPLYQFFTRFKRRNVHWQSLTNFLYVVLEKFTQNVEVRRKQYIAYKESRKPVHGRTKLLRFKS